MQLFRGVNRLVGVDVANYRFPGELSMMIRKTVVWQADAFELIAPTGAGTARVPAGMVFDPHEPFILASRVFPEGRGEPACLLAAVQEAMFTHGVKPDELHVRRGKEKALESLAARTDVRLVIRDELPELAAVKKDLAEYMRDAFACAGAYR